MEEILRNIEHDIATVEGYIKKLRANKQKDPEAGFKIAVYENMVNELYDNYHAVRRYLQKEEANQ